jgi:hypothetical protein
VYEGASLGWDAAEWMADYLPSPADPTQPFLLTEEQLDIILRWYAVDEEGGYLHRRGALEMAKGWGKSPLLAAIALAELVGPVVFDSWNGKQPIGKAWVNPVVEIAAVSEDQTDNTYSALFEMLGANDHKAAKALKIDDGRTRLYLTGRPGVLRPVTASSGSREGARLTFAVLDETHLWTRRNGGVKLAGTLRRNAAKMGGRTFETTNAPLLGEKSVAEQSSADPGILHITRRPAVEPVPTWTDERLIKTLDFVYGDASWVSRERLVKEMRDPATPWDDALRFYFNMRTAGAGRAVDPRRWNELVKPQVIEAGTYIGLGFDGSVSRDSTVLRGCTADGYSFLVKAWVRPQGADLDKWLNEHPDERDWKVDRADVRQTIRETFARYDVGLMLCDPPKWWTEIDDWAEEFGKETVIGLDTNSARRMAPAVDRWLTAIREGTHTNDGDELTADHISAAYLKKVRLEDADDDGRTKYVLIRGDDNRQIDGAVADVLAFEAAMTMPPPSNHTFVSLITPTPGPSFGDDDDE